MREGSALEAREGLATAGAGNRGRNRVERVGIVERETYRAKRRRMELENAGCAELLEDSSMFDVVEDPMVIGVAVSAYLCGDIHGGAGGGGWRCIVIHFDGIDGGEIQEEERENEGTRVKGSDQRIRVLEGED